MPSRKKAKGKARKAAKAEVKHEEEEERGGYEEVDATQTQGTATTLKQQHRAVAVNTCAAEKCKHGFLYTPEEERQCVELIHTLELEVAAMNRNRSAGKCVVNIFFQDNTSTKDILDHMSKMQKVVSFLLRLGTDRLLFDDCAKARDIAYYATFVEEKMKILLLKTQGINATTNGDLWKVDYHTLVRFFQKRIPCACLDEKYEEVKSITKMGLCMNSECSLPGRKAARSKMFYCTRCKQAYYCSKECQIADWKWHKEWCRSAANSQAELESKAKDEE